MDHQYYRKIQRKVGGWLKKIFKKRSALLTLLITVPAVSFMTFSNKGILEHLSLASQKHDMQEKIIQEQEEQHKLQELSKALDSDPKAIEKIAAKSMLWFGTVKRYTK